MKLEDVKGIGPRLAARLREEGVHTLGELRRIDAKALARKTGLPEARVRSWKRQAEKLVKDSVEAAATTVERASREPEALAEEVRRAAKAAAARADELRVVLKEQANTAVVRLGEQVWERVPVIAARVQESEEDLLRSARKNAVVLKEKADTAWVKIEGQLHKGVPIFQEKVEQAGHAAEKVIREVRVAVEEIRERPAVREGERKLGTLFSRMLKRERRGS